MCYYAKNALSVLSGECMMTAIYLVNFALRYIELSGLLPHDSFDGEVWKLLEIFAGKGSEYFAVG